MKIGPFVQAAKLDDLKGDGPFAVSANSVDVVLVRTGAGWRAFEGRCPHQGALLGEGEFDGERIICRNHKWRYQVATGKREGGPQCLASCPVDVRDGAVFLDITGLGGKPKTATATRSLDDLPGPPGLPVLGNLHQIKPERFHLILEQWAAKYGSAYKIQLMGRRIVVTTDPKWTDQILKARPETFRRDSKLAGITAEMGSEGVFSAEGPAWRAQRKLSVAALAQRNLRSLYPAIEKVATRLLARWRKLAEAGATLDIVEEFKLFTVDVTTLITFGYDINTIEQAGDVIQQKLNHVFPALVRRLFAPFPTWRYFKLPQDRKLDAAIRDLKTWLSDLIVKARARLDEDPSRAEKPANFIEAMLVARDGAGEPFSEPVVFGNLMTMLLAGEDTTANSLAWAVHELLASPRWMAELRREADETLGSSSVASSVDAANALDRAAAVANETFRLRPVAALLNSEALADTVVGDVRIPAGTRVMAVFRPAAMEPAHFHDPKAFSPERWLEPNQGAHDTAAMFPFGSGPRMCPGRALALIEMNVALSMLYKNFEVERVGTADEVSEKFSFAMEPVGLRVRLRPRARAV
jgi:cytochrome P450/nitrite reductase/ring-hydroxylating ferredoxin subunit